MSSSLHFHAKTENGLCCPPPLKLNKDSHIIKKSSPASSSSTSSRSSPAQQHQRHGPVIIYTHSPKIIHTHPKDFMSLVQKLTGLSRAEDDEGVVVRHRQGHKSSETGGSANGAASTTMTEEEEDSKSARVLLGNDDTESSSVITEENCSNVVVGDHGNVNGQVSSCFMPPMFEAPSNPYIADIPVFTPNPAEFLPCNQPFYGCTDSIFYMPNNMTKANDF